MILTADDVIAAIAVFTAVGGLFALYAHFNVRLALVENTADESHTDSKQTGKDVAALSSRVNLMEGTVQDIRNSLSKLSVIDSLNANVTSIKESIAEKFRDMVTRGEHEAKWEAQDTAMNDLKSQLAGLRERIDKN